jgi:hypothetical protein
MKIRNSFYVWALTLALAAIPLSVAAEVNAVTPSTNDINRDNGWAHVNQLDVGVGYVELEFVQPRGFAACFEYRTDGDTSQATGNPNFNPGVTDGLYPFVCENSSTSSKTLNATDYVEVRMVFGAEGDERFDWTRFDVLPPPLATQESVDAIETKADFLEMKADALAGEVGGVQGKLDLAYRVQLEKSLRNKECTPALWMPNPDGLLEDLSTYVSDLLTLIEANYGPDPADIDLPKAWEEYGKVAELISKGRYPEACKKLGEAVDKVSKH